MCSPATNLYLDTDPFTGKGIPLIAEISFT